MSVSTKLKSRRAGASGRFLKHENRCGWLNKKKTDQLISKNAPLPLPAFFLTSASKMYRKQRKIMFAKRLAVDRLGQNICLQPAKHMQKCGKLLKHREENLI